MIQSVQKVIKVGTSGAVTIPAKQMKRQNIKIGDQVEVVVRHVSQPTADQEVIKAAKSIINRYKSDFQNLSKR